MIFFAQLYLILDIVLKCTEIFVLVHAELVPVGAQCKISHLERIIESVKKGDGEKNVQIALKSAIIILL